MWTRVRDLVESKGGKVRLNTPVERVFWNPAVSVPCRREAGSGLVLTLSARFLLVLSSAVWIQRLRRRSNAALTIFSDRDFLIVAVIVKETNLFPDNWVYIHDPQVRVGRIQNYSNWSPEMSPDPSVSSLGLEFCSEGDALWIMSDSEMIAFASRELDAIGLVGKPEIRTQP